MHKLENERSGAEPTEHNIIKHKKELLQCEWLKWNWVKVPWSVLIYFYIYIKSTNCTDTSEGICTGFDCILLLVTLKSSTALWKSMAALHMQLKT